ncbi:ATP-binding protein [Rubrivirga sp.]|uniref:ATP-binding protein n=1 Tax=Rubrivirga sp. TaxID=1885344 RepID=UPI003B516DE3
MRRLPAPSRRVVAFLGVAALLGALLGGALLWGDARADAVDPADIERARAETVAHVQRELTALVDVMRRRAEAVAAMPEVVAALDGPDVSAPALEALARLDRPDRSTVEVVASDGTVVAWDGPDFPRLEGSPPDSLRVRAVRDDANRSALVVWVPVRVGGEVVGAVRVVELVQAAVPVRNRYLQDYDVADAWRAGAPVPFLVRFSGARAGANLMGPDGSPLGTVEVGVPDVAALAADRRRQAQSVAAVFGVLLLGWLLAGLGAVLVRAVRAAEARRSPRMWAGAGAAWAALVAAAVASRYALLAADVPVRWLDGTRRPALLFDPALLASDLGGGALRSPGDLAISAAVVLLAAATAFAVVLRWASARARPTAGGPFVLALVGVAVVTSAVGVGAGRWVQQAVLDATIPYADQAGPLLSGPMVAVLAGLLAVLAAAVLAIAAAVRLARAGDARRTWAAGAAALGAAGGAAVAGWVSVGLSLPLAALGVGLAAYVGPSRARWAWPLTARGVLTGVLVLSPVLHHAMQEPLRERTGLLLADAAFAFSDNRDDRVTAAIDQVFDEAQADDALGPALLDAVALADSARGADPVAADSSRRAVDAIAAGLVSSSLLGSLADVATELRIVAPAGDTLGSYVERGASSGNDGLGYAALRESYAELEGQPRFRRLRVPVAERRGLRRTAAVGPVRDGDATAAWLYLRVTPRTARFPTETPFPRVLAPTGLFGLDDEALGYAEYDDGVLVRQRGPAPLRIDSTVYAALSDRARAYRRPETLDGRPTLAYYERQGDDAQDVVAVRAPAPDRLDALFVLLRLSLAGLALGAVVVGIGLYLRRRTGLWPAARTRFRDKVLSRFLIVGVASVALTGVVGQSVIVEQNREAVRDALRQRLSRAAAVFAAEPDAPEGTRLDAVSAALGVDVHLYRGADLVASSRRQLVRQRLIEPRLPGSVYRALYLDDQPFAFSDDRIGTFSYTTGYLALPDSAGRPAEALAIPTLSEQAGIEAGRSRYVATLFGGLLALMAAILVVAYLLASQLTRPFGRLREGLRAVGAGQAEEPIPVDTTDEVGELVETFNAMQAQLAESRRQLAEQERELAWSTMARQVAHEIKNPLMPMKLSVQHLQRTFQQPGDEAPPETVRFAGQFERTTGMLIDQIETLDRIASDFSRFARMPMRAPETVDLREVAREAAALFESSLADSGRAVFDVDLDGPLWIVADREELRRVLVNLLTNALQAIPDRPAPGHVTLRTALHDGAAEARVTDDGTGIAPEIQDSVFQPSFSTKTSGMGLGLAISKRAVEAAGGSITFETGEGGTTFTVRLPLSPDGPPANGDGRHPLDRPDKTPTAVRREPDDPDD